MISKNKNVLNMALSISKESYDPGNSVAAKNPVFDLLMTSYDLE